MGKARSISTGLESVQWRFERWRLRHKPRSRIPDRLWAAAVRAASTSGLHRTAKALRVDYYSLKRRVQQEAAAVSRVPPGGGEVGSFIELTAAASGGACRCDMEWESAGGAKMRVHLSSFQMPDLSALSRSFWDLQS
jgi:hypothetical protein